MPISPKLEIQGLFFPLEDTFSEGHICTEAEAAALNSMRRENIRSAFVRLCKRQGLSLENMTPALLKAFNALAEDYTFTRTTVAKPQDPVEAKAWSIAKDLADAALKKGNVARSELLPGKYEEMISNILEMKPEIMEEARTRVEEIKSLADRITL